MANFTDEETKIVQKKGRPSDINIPVTIRAILKVCNGPDSGTEHKISAIGTTIGRGDISDIQLNDDISSRCHAEISYDNMEFRIKDLESANGTILNGSKVKEYALRNNDKLIIGETMLQFTIDRI